MPEIHLKGKQATVVKKFKEIERERDVYKNIAMELFKSSQVMTEELESKDEEDEGWIEVVKVMSGIEKARRECDDFCNMYQSYKTTTKTRKSKMV